MRRLYWSISTDFDAVQSSNVCGSPKSQKNSLKTSILEFEVVQGHRCWYPRSQAFLDRSIGEWRRRLENVVQCNGGHIEHFCSIEINDACALDLKSFPVLHFHSCNRPRPICLLSCYALVIIVQYSPDGATE